MRKPAKKAKRPTFNMHVNKAVMILKKEVPAVQTRAIELLEQSKMKTLSGAIKRARKELEVEKHW